MSVIIRLQGLPWLANALDIRRYFQGLVVPEGGVHIVGGELGDAFIAFASDEDARQAMQRDGGKVKDTRIKLLLSSRTEMQKVIEQARNPSMGMPAMIAPPQPQPAVPEIGRSRSPEHRSGERREAGRRDHSERPSDRVRDKDRERNRERRRRTKSQSRSPHRVRDRDAKRKDDRNHGPNDRDRGKRDDSRKRSEAVLKQPQKENVMNSLTNPLLATGPGMGNAKISSDNRFPFKQDPGVSAARRNQDQWSNSAPISPWINQPDGFMPLQPQLEKKDWSRSSEMDQFGMQRQFGWNDTEPVRNMKNERGMNERMGKEAFSSQASESFMGRNALLDKPNREQEFATSREPFARDNSDILERRPYNSNLPMGRRDPFDGRERERYPPEGRFNQMDMRRPEPFGLNGRESNNRRPDSFGSRDMGSSFDGLSLRRPTSDSFGKEGLRSVGHNENRMDFRSSEITNDEFDVPGKRSHGGLCVELRGIPYSATPKDIMDFLRGIPIPPINLKLLGDECTLKVTSAVIRFVNEDDLEEALRRNRQYMGNRYVEIVRCADSYYDNAVNIFPDFFNDKRSPEDTSTCVLVKGLPFDCKEDEIHKLFGDNSLKVADVLIEFDRTGLPTGNCFVEFLNNGDAKQASTIKTKMGHKYIDIFMVEKDRMLTAKNFMEKTGHISMMQGSPQPSFMRNSDCCLMQGLPFTASDRDIVRFFSSVNIMPVTIHIMLTKTGQPSGDAFCEFKSIKDCEIALRKNNHQMDKHFINVKPVSRSEMLDALGLLNKPDGATPQGRLSYDERLNDRHSMKSSLVDRSPIDRVPFDRLPMSERAMSRDRGHVQGRHSMHEQLSPLDRVTLQERPSSDHLMHERRLDRIPSERSFDRMPLDRHSIMDRGDRGDFPINDRNVPDGVPRGLQGFGLPGCVVAVQNLPYQATVQDIMNFFKKYGISQENIIRRYNEKGQPTGDARVAFRSPADAQAAANEMNMQNLSGRPINVSRVYDR